MSRAKGSQSALLDALARTEFCLIWLYYVSHNIQNIKRKIFIFSKRCCRMIEDSTLRMMTQNINQGERIKKMLISLYEVYDIRAH